MRQVICGDVWAMAGAATTGAAAPAAAAFRSLRRLILAMAADLQQRVGAKAVALASRLPSLPMRAAPGPRGMPSLTIFRGGRHSSSVHVQSRSSATPSALSDAL